MEVHPDVAAVSCDECKTYLYSSDWKPSMRAGVRNRRPAGKPTPCDSCPKIPDGMPKNWTSACDQPHIRRIINHYLECRAVFRFPKDRLVSLHARVIREVYDELDRITGMRLMARLGLPNG